MANAGKIVTNVRLNIGQPITCLLNKVLKVEVNLAGYIEQELIMLQFPYISGIRNQIIPNNPLAAHLRMSQSLVFFSCAIEHIIEKKRLVLCSYPTSFKVFEARVSRRFPCFMPIAISVRDSYILGVTQDISSNGCQIVLETGHYKMARAIQLKDVLTLEFGVGVSPSFLVSAEVVYLRQGLATTNLGLHFTSIAGDDSAALKQLLQSHSHDV